MKIFNIVALFALLAIAESAMAKNPEPPPPFRSSAPYFVDSSNPKRILGTTLSINTLFSGGEVFLPVTAPNGRATKVVVAVDRYTIKGDLSVGVSFESADCTGTAFAYSSQFPLPGLGPVATVLPVDASPSPPYSAVAAILFVGTSTTVQSIMVGSTSYAMTRDAAGEYSFVCSPNPFPYLNDLVPAESYGNLYGTYHPPFDIVIP